MELFLGSVVIAALIAAAVTVWRTLYGSKNTAASKPEPPQQSVTVNVGIADKDPSGPPRNPGPGSVAKITKAPAVGEPVITRTLPLPSPPVSPLDFIPVASESRYENLTDSVSRQEALVRDIYRASGGNVRMEIPNADADGVRDS